MTGGHLTQKPYYSSHANQSQDGVKCGCQGTHSPPLSLAGSVRKPSHLQKVRGVGGF